MTGSWDRPSAFQHGADGNLNSVYPGYSSRHRWGLDRCRTELYDVQVDRQPTAPAPVPPRTLEALAEDLARATSSGSIHVVVDGQGPDAAAVVADRLAGELRAIGHHYARLTDRTPLADEDAWRAQARPGMVVVADGPRWRANPPSGSWDVLVDPERFSAPSPT